KPVPTIDPVRLQGLIADLESDDFTVRQKASEELEKLGDRAGPALRKALVGQPALETRQRLARLLEYLETAQLASGELLRSLRAVELLESLATPQAQAILEQWAAGATGARLTREAQASLRRLAKRSGL